MLTLKDFASCILRSGLVEKPLLTELAGVFRSEKPSADAQSFARFLIKRKVLTTYQAKRLLAGRSEGFLIGGCRILDRLGEGGMGVVYLGLQQSLDRQVAIKVLPESQTKNRESLERFYREAKAAAKLKHTNIVQVFDVGQQKQTHYIVMELVNGRNLSEHLRKRKYFGVGESAALIRQAAEGLQHAHASGVVHRDIKPANLVLEGNVLRILDLGLARHEADEKLTADHTIMGTADYMSPEQCQGSADVDHQSDLYSLGCSWFHLLAGKAPFADRSMTGKLLSHVTDPLPSITNFRDDVPQSVDTIIQRMTAKSKDERYPNAAALLADLKVLESSLSGETVAIAPLAANRRPASTTTEAPPESQGEDIDSDDSVDEAPDPPTGTLIQRPRSSTGSLVWLLPMMAALVLGGVYIGMQILSDRLQEPKIVTPDRENQSSADDSASVNEQTSLTETLPAKHLSDSATTLASDGMTTDEVVINDASKTVDVLQPKSLVLNTETTADAAQSPASDSDSDASMPVLKNDAPVTVNEQPSSPPPTSVATRAPHETVLRSFDGDWQSGLVDGDVLNLISPDVYETETALQQHVSLTIQGTPQRRAIIHLDGAADAACWAIRNSRLTLRHVDIYVSLPEGTDEVSIFQLNASDISLNDASLTILEPQQRDWQHLTVVNVAEDRPWDEESNQQIPEPVHIEVERCFIRGEATLVKNFSAQSSVRIVETIANCTGPVYHAVHTTVRKFAHQKTELTIENSTIDVEQSPLMVSCRPFDLRPVPTVVRLQASLFLTSTPVFEKSPLVQWATPVSTVMVADGFRFVGIRNVYCDRPVIFRALSANGGQQTICQHPDDWKKQQLGDDTDSSIKLNRTIRWSGDHSERTPRDFSSKSLLRGTHIDGEFGADVREHRIPRRLPLR